MTGSVILIIGSALLPTAAEDIVAGTSAPEPANGPHFAPGLGTLALVVITQPVFRGFVATLAVPSGLVVGTLVTRAIGAAGFSRWERSAASE